MTDFAHQLQSDLVKTTEQTQRQVHAQSDAQSRMALTGLTAPKDTAVSKGIPTQVDMDMAIADLWDLQESVMFKFIVIGKLAEAIHNNDQFYMGKVQVMMPTKYLTPEVKSLFTTWNYTKEKYGYSYRFTPPIRWDIHIPIEIHVIQRHYDFFDNPDVGFYGTNEFKLPNPFHAYWKARNLIQ